MFPETTQRRKRCVVPKHLSQGIKNSTLAADAEVSGFVGVKRDVLAGPSRGRRTLVVNILVISVDWMADRCVAGEASSVEQVASL